MRFSAISLLALPLLASAAEPAQHPRDQIVEQATYWFNKFASYIPSPSAVHDEGEAAAAKAGGKAVNVLTLSNWKSKLQTTPGEWWVLVTGGNKTCFGQCDQINAAFNESALSFATTPTAPHLAYLNCDQQPVLCNSWGVGPPVLWAFDVKGKGEKTAVHIQRLNTTTTTANSFHNLHRTKKYLEGPAYEGYFHPFDGPIAEFGLSTPLGYALWVFGLIPSWMFMIGVSFASRTFMGRRAATDADRARAAPRPAGAPPGDAAM